MRDGKVVAYETTLPLNVIPTTWKLVPNPSCHDDEVCGNYILQDKSRTVNKREKKIETA